MFDILSTQEEVMAFIRAPEVTFATAHVAIRPEVGTRRSRLWPRNMNMDVSATTITR